MEIHQVSLKEANDFVTKYHRHHKAAQGHKFSIGVFEGGVLHGVAMVGRPLSRFLDDGSTLEVTRLCTDGTYNACAMLYGRCARLAKDFGYSKIITYILETEDGTSLKASGWKCEDDHVGGGDWSKSARRQEEYEQLNMFEEPQKYPMGIKKRYTRDLKGD